MGWTAIAENTQIIQHCMYRHVAEQK